MTGIADRHVRDPVLPRHVLGPLHLSLDLSRGAGQGRREPLEGLDTRRRQLTGRRQGAHTMRALVEEPGAAAAHVDTGTGAIAVGGGAGDGHRRLECQLADAAQRVGEHLGFERPLSGLGDVGQHLAAARQARGHIDAVG